jgi:hypothetical protein
VALAVAGLMWAMPERPAGQARPQHENAVIDLWMAGKPAFGIYVPNEAPRGRRGGRAGRGGETSPPPVPAPPDVPPYSAAGGERLAANPLYDFVFLNLEGAYDVASVSAIATGLRAPGATGRKTLIVRIPSIETAGAGVTKARVREVFDAGGDGVTLPHIRGLDEARQALGFFRDAGVNVWSPANPTGEKIAMLMLEDPDSVAQAGAMADLPGISILACGIGSLRGALGGDAAGAEAGTQKVLAETKRVKIANMLTANTRDVEQRVKEGFLALLMQGAQADEAITLGRAAAGR